MMLLGKLKCFSDFFNFKKGKMSIDDKPHSNRPSTARTDEIVDKICEIVLKDQRPAIEELKQLFRVTWSSVQSDLLQSSGCFFHHNNVPAHIALYVLQFFNTNAMIPVPHLPVHLTLAHENFFIPE